MQHDAHHHDQVPRRIGLLAVVFDGLELADSYCFNPHKWMFTNFDCDCFFVARRAELIRTLSILPEYLRNRATESGAVIDYRDWQSVRPGFRALAVVVLRWYRLRLRAMVRSRGAGARRGAGQADPVGARRAGAAQPRCFRHRGAGDEPARARRQCLRQGLLTHTRLDSRSPAVVRRPGAHRATSSGSGSCYAKRPGKVRRRTIRCAQRKTVRTGAPYACSVASTAIPERPGDRQPVGRLRLLAEGGLVDPRHLGVGGEVDAGDAETALHLLKCTRAEVAMRRA
jgi:hypothetical protein